MEKLKSQLSQTPAKVRNSTLYEKLKANIKLIEDEKSTIDIYTELLEYELKLQTKNPLKQEVLYDLKTKKPLRGFSPKADGKVSANKKKPSSAKSVRSVTKESQNVNNFKSHFSGILEELRLKLIENRINEKSLQEFFESKEDKLTYRDLLDAFQKKPFLMEMSVELEQLCRFIVDSENIVYNHENAVSNSSAFSIIQRLLDKYIILPEEILNFVFEKNRKLLEEQEAYEMIHGFLKFKAQSCEYLDRSIIMDLFNRLEVELLDIELDVIMARLFKMCGSISHLQPFKLFDALGVSKKDPNQFKCFILKII